jgi:hypothetical protein
LFFELSKIIKTLLPGHRYNLKDSWNSQKYCTAQERNMSKFIGILTLIILLLTIRPAVSASTSPFSEEQLQLLQSNQVDSVIDELSQIDEEISSLGNEEQQPNGATDNAGAVEVTVVRGDTLSGLAKRLLGDPWRWRDLVEWNCDRYPSLLKNPDLILVAWKLRLSPPGAKTKPKVPAKDITPVAANQAGKNGAKPQEPAAAEETGRPAVNSDCTSQPLINADSRVLHIGDSHTCGIYGKAMDDLMRETDATVRTYGVSGSSPSWWLNETTGKSGYYAKDEQGKVDQPADWRTPRKTPNFRKLLNEYRPDVVMFSLGANLVHASPAAIRRQVESVCKIAKEAGCKIVWVGPPRSRSGVRDPQKRQALYQNLKSVAEQYGTFVDSREYTKYPETGGDGVHYWGKEGSRIARDWAGKVFDNIQNTPAQ